MTQTKNILVGLDFSPGSVRAVEYAVELAQQLSATLHIVHVVEPLPVASMEAVQVYVDLNERKLQCEEVCQRIVANRAPHTLRVFDAIALDGLLAAIYELKPELVVVGSHGRGAVMRLLTGSVSSSLCRKSPVPVVVVPPAEQVAAIERELAEAAAIA